MINTFENQLKPDKVRFAMAIVNVFLPIEFAYLWKSQANCRVSQDTDFLGANDSNLDWRKVSRFLSIVSDFKMDLVSIDCLKCYLNGKGKSESKQSFGFVHAVIDGCARFRIVTMEWLS